MGERHPSVIGHRHKRRNARHHFEAHAGISKFHCLFASAAKHVGVTTFEPHHGLARSRLGDQQLIQLVLGNRGELRVAVG